MQAPEFSTGSHPSGVATADFDGDGKQDIAATFNLITNGFSVLRNLGSNQFASKVDFAIPQFGTFGSIFAYDLDRDGKTDVILAEASGKKISVLKNTSSGTGIISFAPRTEYTVGGNQPRSIAFADFDGDGSPDIVTANRDSELSTPNPSSSVSILRNTSAGTGTISFTPRIDILQNYLSVLTTADFDGDGKLDIAVGGDHNFGIRVLRNISSGIGDINFISSVSYDITGEATALVAVDLDSDGKLDIVAPRSLNSGIAVFRNTGSGSGNINFSQQQSFDTGLAPFGAAAADFDGDGKIDIATANNNGNSVSILRNTSSSTGTIGFAPRQWDFGVGISPDYLAINDFNSDGKPDIVTVNRIGENVSVLINSGTVANVDFVARKDYLSPNKTGVTSLTSGDLDGDGKQEIIATFDEPRDVFRFSVYRKNENGQSFSRLDILTGGFKPTYVATADFNNDGKLDLVAQTTAGLVVFKNTSNAAGIGFVSSFGAVHGFPSRVWTADLDGDGKQDFIATFKQPTGSSNETAFIYRNTSSGNDSFSFTQAASFTLPGSPKISFADLNLDNKIDLAYDVLQGSTSVIRVQLNTGSSPGQISFTPQDITAPGVSFDTAVTGDLNGDGKADLISGNIQNVYFLKNTSSLGVLSFASTQVFPNLFVLPTEVADINGDGKQDVLAREGPALQNFISILKNDSAGNGTVILTLSAKFAVGGNTNQGNQTSLIAADLDNNGKLAVVNGFSSPFTGTISVLLNEPCTLSIKTPLDFDGDGKADTSVYRPASGMWYLLNSNIGFASMQFGLSTDKIVPADYDNDRRTDIAVYRSGTWFLQRSTQGFTSVQFGAPEDIPVPADFDADGKTDLAVYRPSNGTWYVLNGTTNKFTSQQWGLSTDKPVVADYDGDGRADYAVYRPSNGTWYLFKSRDGFAAIQWGESTDKPVVGDYDGDGKAHAAVYRPSNGTWYLLRSRDGFSSTQWGEVTDLPVPADYDGDGKTDVAVFRPSNGTWYLLKSTEGFAAIQFGDQSDRPIPNAIVP